MDNLKELYRDYLDGKTSIEKVDGTRLDEIMIKNDSGFGLYIAENNGKFRALSGHADEDRYDVDLDLSFESEALAAAYLLGADEDQVTTIDKILREAKNKGQACFEDVEDALLSPAPRHGGESMVGDSLSQFQMTMGFLRSNNGIYDPVHSVYIDPLVSDKLGGASIDNKRITFYDVTVDDIEECMNHGTKFLDEVPDQIHVIGGSAEICSIPISGPDDPTIETIATTVAGDERWCDVTGLDIGGFEHFKEIIEKNDHIEGLDTKVNQPVAHDEWRDGMASQVLGQMDAIEGLDAVGERDANTVLADTFKRADLDEAGIGNELLNLYLSSDDSGREAISQMFYTLSGTTFDSFLMEASEACEETLGAYEYGCEDKDESLDEMMAAKDEESGFEDMSSEMDIEQGAR